MSKYEPLSTASARGRLSSAIVHGGDVDAARATLVTANLDREIRRHMKNGGLGLSDVQVAHLVCLLLSENGVAGSVVDDLYSVIRDVVRDTQGGDA